MRGGLIKAFLGISRYMHVLKFDSLIIALYTHSPIEYISKTKMKIKGVWGDKMANRFGSVEWQNEQADRILQKIMEGKELDSLDNAFIAVQSEHNKR
jgi:hypothetical protein